MDEVHREIQSPARFVHSAIVYLDDTRMVEARKETSFGEKAGLEKFRSLALRDKHLHGTAQTELQMLDLVHLRHAAPSEEPHHAVSRDNLAAKITHALTSLIRLYLIRKRELLLMPQDSQRAILRTERSPRQPKP